MAGDLPQFPSLRPCEMEGWRQLLLFGEPRPAQDPRTWAGPAARSAVAERRRSPAEALPAARRPRKRWKAGKLQPKRGQARTWKFCSHFKIVARARHAQCSICNKCIRPFDLVERCASHQTIFHHRCTIDPSPPLSVLHCLNTCVRHIVQFRQPKVHLQEVVAMLTETVDKMAALERRKAE